MINTLILLSLFFYAYWNPNFLFLLVPSMIGNYLLSKLLIKNHQRIPAKVYLLIGVAINLAILAYFKYKNFFYETTNFLLETETQIVPLVLPLAISFFTFQQIAYLVDIYQGKISPGKFVNYVAFVAFFPQLIAGPIVHYRGINQQFNATRWRIFDGNLFNKGVMLFSIGLFKKIILADSLASFSNPVFDSAMGGEQITSLNAVIGMFSYSFQLYFDFSGYADMALGIAAMFGILLPINFKSPYRATSIIDFWQRWHITLSHFLRDYIYIPLGGNRKGVSKKHSNLLITMLLGGLWHGAGWTFVLWGGVQGLLLVLNNCWSSVDFKIPVVIAVPLTFITVSLAWVLFRAENLESALSVYHALLQPQGVVTGLTQAWNNLSVKAMLEMRTETAYVWLVFSTIIVLILPNSHTFVEFHKHDKVEKSSPSVIKGVFCGILLFIALNHMTAVSVSEFLYFNF
jgi:D-alanyl-lipoteichoic acid acyltransferase DltB (MBOAT superfamily)